MLCKSGLPRNFQRGDPGSRAPPQDVALHLHSSGIHLRKNSLDWQSNHSLVPDDPHSCHWEAGNTQGVEISHLGWSTEQLCAWGYRDQWDPANASSGIFWAGRISLSVPLFPVFSKTTENIALTNKPIAVSSPKWCKTNSIKKRNCNRFDLLNTCKHLLCRN